jgi:2-polyprenyl-6-methoxyphenol hydroxylase-like FAD-dependent oxidoreductase
MSGDVVVGAGIIGLAVAHELQSRGHRVVVLEKERRVAEHPARAQFRRHPLRSVQRTRQSQGGDDRRGRGVDAQL